MSSDLWNYIWQFWEKVNKVKIATSFSFYKKIWNFVYLQVTSEKYKHEHVLLIAIEIVIWNDI